MEMTNRKAIVGLVNLDTGKEGRFLSKEIFDDGNDKLILTLKTNESD